AISIMTIHGAKGLEFPITVLSGLSARPQPPVRGAHVTFDDDDQAGVAIRQGITTLNHAPLAAREREMDRYERLRLLYVAATRARDHLVVSCHRGTHATESFAATLWKAAEAHDDTWRRPPTSAESADAAASRADAAASPATGPSPHAVAPAVPTADER